MKKLIVIVLFAGLSVSVSARDPTEAIYYGVEYGEAENRVMGGYKPVVVSLHSIVDARGVEKSAMFTIEFSSGVTMHGNVAVRGDDVRVLLFNSEPQGVSMVFMQKMIVTEDAVSFSFNPFSPFSYVVLSRWPWDNGAGFFVQGY